MRRAERNEERRMADDDTSKIGKCASTRHNSHHVHVTSGHLSILTGAAVEKIWVLLGCSVRSKSQYQE